MSDLTLLFILICTAMVCVVVILHWLFNTTKHLRDYERDPYEEEFDEWNN